MLSRPQKSIQHNQLEALSGRMMLSNELNTQLKRLNSGYEGELIFFNLLRNQLPADTVKLFDLTIDVNSSICQIDCLLFFQSKLFILEIKHYSGEFVLKNDNWYTIHQTEIKNPLHQLKRTEILVKQLLNKYKLKTDIESFLIFIHPEFHLYGAPQELPIIFPSQLNRFIKKLQTIPNRLNPLQKRFISTLYSLHQPNYFPVQNIQFEFNHLNKGFFCWKCHQLMKAILPRVMRCTSCLEVEKIESSIGRSIIEYQLLFPELKITTNQISKWIDHQASPYQIKKVLSLL